MNINEKSKGSLLPWFSLLPLDRYNYELALRREVCIATARSVIIIMLRATVGNIQTELSEVRNVLKEKYFTTIQFNLIICYWIVTVKLDPLDFHHL